MIQRNRLKDPPASTQRRRAKGGLFPLQTYLGNLNATEHHRWFFPSAGRHVCCVYVLHYSPVNARRGDIIRSCAVPRACPTRVASVRCFSPLGSREREENAGGCEASFAKVRRGVCTRRTTLRIISRHQLGLRDVGAKPSDHVTSEGTPPPVSMTVGCF